MDIISLLFKFNSFVNIFEKVYRLFVWFYSVVTHRNCIWMDIDENYCIRLTNRYDNINWKNIVDFEIVCSDDKTKDDMKYCFIHYLKIYHSISNQLDKSYYWHRNQLILFHPDILRGWLSKRTTHDITQIYFVDNASKKYIIKNLKDFNTYTNPI